MHRLNTSNTHERFSRKASMNRSHPRVAPAIASVALALAAALPFAAGARRPFIVPSETVLARPGWVTFDGAVSNDLFYFNHQPLRLDNLQALGAGRPPGPIEQPDTRE